jgi:dimethylargininase
VRTPGASFAEGLTSATLGRPDHDLALAQHRAYCEALLECGLALTWLPADADHPDSTFVEDTAVITPRGAILTRPGAPSRAGEVGAIRPTLEVFFPRLRSIEAPGTLDGGDVCEAGRHVFIGLSGRTNEAGAAQLRAFLAEDGYTSSLVDIRGMAGLLHLKSGLAALDERRLALIGVLDGEPAFRAFERLTVSAADAYAANCVAVNGRLLVAAGHAEFESAVRALGLDPLPLEMSEFEKMDGGLSCLSLRF